MLLSLYYLRMFIVIIDKVYVCNILLLCMDPYKTALFIPLLSHELTPSWIIFTGSQKDKGKDKVVE